MKMNYQLLRDYISNRDEIVKQCIRDIHDYLPGNVGDELEQDFNNEIRFPFALEEKALMLDHIKRGCFVNQYTPNKVKMSGLIVFCEFKIKHYLNQHMINTICRKLRDTRIHKYLTERNISPEYYIATFNRCSNREEFLNCHAIIGNVDKVKKELTVCSEYVRNLDNVSDEDLETEEDFNEQLKKLDQVEEINNIEPELQKIMIGMLPIRKLRIFLNGRLSSSYIHQMILERHPVAKYFRADQLFKIINNSL